METHKTSLSSNINQNKGKTNRRKCHMFVIRFHRLDEFKRDC